MSHYHGLEGTGGEVGAADTGGKRILLFVSPGRTLGAEDSGAREKPRLTALSTSA